MSEELKIAFDGTAALDLGPTLVGECCAPPARKAPE